MVPSPNISCRKIQPVPKIFGIKCKNRKYPACGPWCQSRGTFSDNVSCLQLINFFFFSWQEMCMNIDGNGKELDPRWYLG